MHARDLERHLLHRPGEVHGVRRLPRSRGVRGGVPGRLLRPESADSRDARGACSQRARSCIRARRSPDDAPSRLQEGRARRRGRRACRRRLRRAAVPPPRRARRRRRRLRRARPRGSRSRRPRTGRCRSTASAARATTACRSRTSRRASSSAVRSVSAATVPTLEHGAGRDARGDRRLLRQVGDRVRSVPTTSASRDLEHVRGAPAPELERIRSEGCVGSRVARRCPARPTKRKAVLLVLTRRSSACGSVSTTTRSRVRTARRPTSWPTLVFTHPGRDTEFAHRLVALLLEPDARFRFDEVAGRWIGARPRAARAPRSPTPSSSSSTSRRRAARRARTASSRSARCASAAGGLHDTFTTLVNPGVPIPPFVDRAHGHHRTRWSPTRRAIAEALPRFLEFAGDAVLVAHNAPFDVGHLNGRAPRARGPADRRRRRVHAARSRDGSCRSSSGRASTASRSALGIACRSTAIAGSATRSVTAEVLCVFLERLVARRRPAARRSARVPAAGARRSPVGGARPARSAGRRAGACPASIDSSARTDGSSTSAARGSSGERLAGYFASPESHSSRTLAMLRLVHDFTVRHDRSELAAALLEGARHPRRAPAAQPEPPAPAAPRLPEAEPAEPRPAARRRRTG